MNRIHFWVGITGILVFIGTGQYMQHYHDALQGMADAPRLLYRSSHIYLLLTSITNLALGIYIPSKNPEFTWYKYVFSLGLVISPVIITVGFFLESDLSELNRPYTGFAVKMLFLLSTFTVLALTYRRWKKVS